MKTFLLLPVILLALTSDPFTNPGMPDPASAYCKFLGYHIVVRKDLKGNEYGVCVFPDRSECDTWDFFRGICGKEFSYCAKKGCETYSITEDRGSYTAVYCACGCPDSSGITKKIPLLEFMAQHGDTLIKPKPGIRGAGLGSEH